MGFALAVTVAAALVLCAPYLLMRTAVHTGGVSLLPVHAIIVLTWAYGVGPQLLNVVAHGRSGSALAANQSLSNGGQIGTLLSVMVMALCAFLIIRGRATAHISMRHLAAFLAPWFAFQIISGLAHAEPPSRQVILYPLLGLAFAVTAPPLRVMATLGWLTLLTGIFTLLWGLVSPLATIRGVGFTDKALLGQSLLAGPFGHPNQFGLAMALGLPSILLIRTRIVKAVGIPLVLVAVVWSASRTSLLAALVCLSLYAVLRNRPGRARPWVMRAALLGGVSLLVLTPLLTTDPAAYSSRGQIWLQSLQDWKSHPWFGLGPRFYSDIAKVSNGYGPYAFHGHNLLINSLILGGAVGAAAVALQSIAIWRRARGLWPMLFLITFVFTGWLEVATDFSNLGELGYVTWVPLAAALFCVLDPAADRVAMQRREPQRLASQRGRGS